jgi:hypothetical protein
MSDRETPSHLLRCRKRVSDRYRLEPRLISCLVAVHDCFHKSDAFQAVIGKRHVPTDRAGLATVSSSRDRFGEASIEVGESFEITAG